MKFLTLYTPSASRKGPRSPEHMAKMGAHVQKSFESGVLVATGGVMASAATGARASLVQGDFKVEFGPFASTLQQAGGYAILNVQSRDHLLEEVRAFLEIAGDGESEMIEILEAPRP